MPASILHGDCLALLPTLPANSIDAIVTDPPAGIAFMGKAWDKDKGGRDHWIAWMQQVAAECLRCIKPGGHALVWALPRTSHWTATAWENAGWEVRDVVHHLFGSGFPKSLNVSVAIDKRLGAEREVVGKRVRVDGRVRAEEKSAPIYGRNSYLESETNSQDDVITAPATPEAQQFAGWGTALKPACENWILLRKPLIATVAQNVLKHGTGGINVDSCRVPTTTQADEEHRQSAWSHHEHSRSFHGQKYRDLSGVQAPAGRWPANLVTDGSDEVVECFPHSKSSNQVSRAGVRSASGSTTGATFGGGSGGYNLAPNFPQAYGDEGSSARFFPALGYSEDERRFLYCSKASKRDRAGSIHPTVKPIKLMEWLCRLICPPKGTILDPFAGSGSTGQAAQNLGFDCILIEQDAEYVRDIHRRLDPNLMTRS